MPVVLALVGLGALAFMFMKSHPAAGPSVNDVPVVFGDDKTVATKMRAAWHATNDQNQLFGPRKPNYWSLNGYFLFQNAKGGFDKYKPDWKVETTGTFA